MKLFRVPDPEKGERGASGGGWGGVGMKGKDESLGVAGTDRRINGENLLKYN